MHVLIVVPSSQNARLVASWTKVSAEPDDQFEFICLEPEGNQATQQSVRSALSEDQLGVSTINSIFGTAPLSEVFERVRKFKPRLLITGGFSFPSFEGRPQSSEELIRAAPCMTICPLFGEVQPDQTNSNWEVDAVSLKNGQSDAYAALRTPSNAAVYRRCRLRLD